MGGGRRIAREALGTSSIGAALLFAACGGLTRSDPSPVPTCGAPPPSRDAAPLVASRTRVYAIRKLYYGDADRDGNASRDAWRSFGYDIDGRATPDGGAGLCKLHAPGDGHQDGSCGTDNSFGRNLVAIFPSLFGADFAAQRNADIEGGGFTDLLVVDDVGDARHATSVHGAILQAGALGHTPAWDGNDAWPIDRASLSGTTTSTAKLGLSAWIADRTWVGAGRAATGALTLMLYKGVPFRFPVTHVVVAARISDDASRLLEGTMSAVIPVDGAVRAFQQLVEERAACCYGGCFDSLAYQARYAADILADGTQDATRDCDAISIGIGFEASEVTAGPLVDVPAPTDQCDAGVDAPVD